MKYRTFIDGDFFDTSGIADYIVSYDKKYNFAHIEFESDEACDIWNKMKWQEYYDKGCHIFALDENGNRYELSADGIGEATPGKFSYEKNYKRQCDDKDSRRKISEQIERRAEKYAESGICKSRLQIGKYKAFTYVDRENKISFPYRLKRSKGTAKQPLVVYFHGAGALGFDNLKPWFEFRPIGKKLKNYNANILLPQAPKPAHADKLLCYSADVAKLIKELCREETVDPRRIYLVGTSFGGSCVWQLLLDNPEMFACGVPVMGCLPLLINSKQVKFDSLKNTPIWIAHASDDDNVTIESDDFCFEQLKKLDAPVKYTRFDKYGHGMSKYFYRDEKWAEWMFRQERP